ncbi:hypothetical protein E3P99_01252 [Wallemia hederae]|uniref:RRM domain-containing protein n=1 Tax=Wallemia hederae TaxID=1540922 RepID=A0A4T0FST4_9BASI|nr:hypothetical protein E3P99_01252 [Wallemia hederae]
MHRHLGLLVKNLPPHLPESSIKNYLENHARVKDIYTFRASPFGGSSGQTLVHFKNAFELSKALKLNGQLLNNYKLKIEPTARTPHQLRFPVQRPVRYKFRSKLLYVTGQPLDATQEELEVAFRRFGRLRWVQNFHRDRKKFSHAYAFVLYDTPEFATKAYENGVYLRGDNKLKLSFFKRPIKYPQQSPIKLGFKGNRRIFKKFDTSGQ